MTIGTSRPSKSSKTINMSDVVDEEVRVNFIIKSSLRTKFKTYAAQNNTTMNDIITKLITDFLNEKS